ncbi:mediator of RNA polymerase II transcription subunit 33A [Pyrus ussuriensis x Pyrus communis]|uniref:Mediator of RNA polymerase II transcription subunit 33A n=1 Tax=Pyrus ussuriensis x Pyrus communis TaxID=2448454 RepID=A0A5N5HGK4_9ROSA|nr:mediator of RNA polymerase II transcription subunit 33A [Pyrus ussuriensis x Pyrus communis]KAB2625327.1 mediator of RNA polymerase II transcription subunit 33A [Pyrus ussuriensis x Pyrus communis]
MAEPKQSSLWDALIMQTKEAQENGSDPLLRSMEVSSNLSSAGVSLLSMELAGVLVSHICWENNVPIIGFEHGALHLVLALLSSRSVLLLDSSLDDEGLLELVPEKKSVWPTKPQDMDIDGLENHHEERNEQYERLQSRNTVMAIALIAQFLQNVLASKILNLAKRNMHVALQCK